MLNKIAGSFIFLLLCVSILNAQYPSYTNYNTKDGLPSNEVYDVEVGPKGLIWFTTDRGVCTYDGYTFKSYNSGDGLAANTNFEIFKDSNDRLWFCGFNGKLSIYEDGTFYPYAYNDSLVNLLGSLWIGDIIEAENDNFYFAPYRTKNASIYKLKIDAPPKQVDDLLFDKNLNITASQNDTIISANSIGFSYFRKRNAMTVFPLISKKMSSSSWIYFRNKSIQKTDSKGNSLQGASITEYGVNFFIEDNKHLWVSTHHGLYYFANSDLESPPIHYFKDYNITSCIKDFEGNFWVSTLQNGVLFIPAFNVEIIRPQETSNTNERCLTLENLENHIYSGTSQGRILAINSLGKIDGEPKQQKTNSQIRFLIKDKNRLYSNKLSIKEVKGKISYKEMQRSSSFRKKLSNGDFFTFSTEGFSIVRPGLIQSIDPNSFRKKINTVKQDKNNNIWIGTLDGLHKISNYDYENASPILFDQRDTFGRINDIVIDKFENRWVATIGNGLFYHTNDHIIRLKKEDGLISNLINQIYLLNDSMIYLATNKGLSVFNYSYKNKTLQLSAIKNLTTADGLSSNFINDVHYWNERIWLATDNSINAFKPNILNRKSPIIPIAINEFTVNDSSYNFLEKLSFQHDQNDIFINFTGISFRKGSEKSFYRYHLKTDGQTSKWFYTNEKNIRYNDLPPGKYIFEVSAQNKSGLWNESPASVSWEIKPHFTQTRLFRILVVLITLALIGYIFYFQNKRTKLRETQKSYLQDAQLRTREAELAALRNQMNPHFVFNSLNSIQNFIFKQDTKKANYYLSKFSALMRNSLQYTRLEFIPLEKELDFLKDYLELEAMRFPDKFRFTINIEEDLSPEYLLVPSLLFQPIIENAIKHAFKEKKSDGLIELEVFKKDENSLEIYIRDNGPGISINQNQIKAHNNKHKSLGMEIIKNRIALLNESNLSINSSVRFINRADINKDKTGLEVHFILPILYKS